MSKPNEIRSKLPGHYHHGDLRRALIDAALQIIEQDGIVAMTTRELARRLGVSHGAPAHHFRDREALLVEVATEGFRALGDALAAAAAAASGPSVRLRAIGVAYVRFAVEHPAHFRVMFSDAIHAKRRTKKLEREVERAYQVLIDSAGAMVGAGVSSGLLEDMIYGNWSLVHGMATLWIDGPGRRAYQTRPQFEATVTRILGRMVSGSNWAAAG